MFYTKITSVLLVCFAIINRGKTKVRMDSCSIQCGHGSETTLPGPATVRYQGPPGKRGPRGLKGSKGESSNQCDCATIHGLATTIQKLQVELNKTKNALNPRGCNNVLPRYESDQGGVYAIYPYPGGYSGVQVYCDLNTDGGGWIVFQRRMDGSEDFFRGWNDYVNGFGKLDREFWLGLEKLHRITSSGNYELRVDMEDFENNTRYARHESFVVGPGTDFAITKIGSYSGNAVGLQQSMGLQSLTPICVGSALPHAGTRFSTKDKDQDTYGGSCAAAHKGGWWYGACHSANPNGLYLNGSHTSYANGVNWKPFRGHYYSLKRIEMKLRLIH